MRGELETFEGDEAGVSARPPGKLRGVGLRGLSVDDVVLVAPLVIPVSISVSVPDLELISWCRGESYVPYVRLERQTVTGHHDPVWCHTWRIWRNGVPDPRGDATRALGDDFQDQAGEQGGLRVRSGGLNPIVQI